MPSSSSFNYSSSTTNNKVLRYALWKIWGEACYWCGRPLEDSTYAQIDHILPQSEFNQAVADFGRHPTFELHAAENLAPVCEGGRRCNQKKPEKNLTRVRGAIEQALSDAADRAPAVRDLQQRIARAKGTDKAFISFITDDLDDRTRRIATEYGKELVQKIHEISPKLVDSYFTTKAIHGEFEPDLPHEMRRTYDYLPLQLDAEARFAFTVAARIYGVKLEQKLGEMVESSLDIVDFQAENKTPIASPLFDNRSKLESTSRRRIALSYLDLAISANNDLRVRFMLHIEQDYAASGVKTNQDAELIDFGLEWEANAEFVLVIKLGRKGCRAKPKLQSISLTESGDGNWWDAHIDEFDR